MSQFEEIVDALRSHFTVVKVSPNSNWFCHLHYDSVNITNMRNKDATHLQVFDNGYFNYRAWNMSAWFDKIVAALRELYNVKVVFSASPGMHYLDACVGWIERFQQKHAEEKWTHLKLFNDADKARIGYSL